MSKTLLITGLVFLIVGVSLLIWVNTTERAEQHRRNYYKSKYAAEPNLYLGSYQQWLDLPEEERDQLPWGLEEGAASKSPELMREQQQERLQADLEKLSAIKPAMYPVAEVLYGKNWRQELAKYKKQKALRSSVFAAGIVVSSVAAALVLGCASVPVTRYTFRLLVRKKSSDAAKLSEPQANGKSDNTASAESQEPTEKQAPPEHSPSEGGKRLHALLGCAYRRGIAGPQQKGETTTQKKQAPAQAVCSTADSQSSGPADDKAGQFNTQAELLDERIRLLCNLAKSNKGALHKTPQAIDKTLRKLTEEVAAIRHYASQQQDRVKKLQEGYDWNIIRNFCLRVIRCIDNLEERISLRNKEKTLATDLEEIRDELVFALESSGVERFEPQLHSDYRGQEKTVEAITARQSTEEAELKGKIAKVIKCGYRYIVDESSFKVVRPAQVKLFR